MHQFFQILFETSKSWTLRKLDGSRLFKGSKARGEAGGGESYSKPVVLHLPNSTVQKDSLIVKNHVRYLHQQLRDAIITQIWQLQAPKRNMRFASINSLENEQTKEEKLPEILFFLLAQTNGKCEVLWDATRGALGHPYMSVGTNVDRFPAFHMVHIHPMTELNF